MTKIESGKVKKTKGARMEFIVFRKIVRMGDFVGNKQGLGIPKIVFRFPGILCSEIPLPSDQEGAASQPSVVP